MKKVQLNTRPVRPPGSLAATAKATRQMMSDQNDPALARELAKHDAAVQAERRRRRMEAERKKFAEHEKAQTVKKRQARRDYDKAMMVARRRNIKKAIRRGKSTIVHSQESRAYKQKLKAQEERAEEDKASRQDTPSDIPPAT